MYNKAFLENNIIGDKMIIKDIMSKNIICADAFDNVVDVTKLMKKYNIGFIPIKDEEIIGVVTDRDIALNLENIDTNTNICNIMSNEIISINENESIDKALDIMSKYKIKRILVKEKNDYTGILSLSDIIKYRDITDTIKIIFYVKDNSNLNDSEIDDFYL